MPRLSIQQIQKPSPTSFPRLLTLDGAAGPIDEIEWGISQRHSLRRYPGNSAGAAARLDGGEPKPTTFRFEWRTRAFGPQDVTFDGAYPLDADRLVEILTGMVADRALVRVEWRARVQVGILTDFTPAEGFDGEYPTATLEVAWVDPPGFQPRPFAAETPPRSLFEQMRADFDAGVAAAIAPISALRRVVEEVESGIDDVNTSFRRFDAVTREIDATTRASVQVYRGVGEVLSTIATQGTDILGALTAPPGAIAQTDDPLTQVRAAAYASRVSGAARRARAKAALERPYYRAIEHGELAGVHLVAPGETVWSIAWRWYGDPDTWAPISRRNGLATPYPEAGRRLYIPRRTGRAA